MYPRVFFEQEVLRVLAELNAIEIARIACACITTRDFYLSSNRAVPYNLEKDKFLHKLCKLSVNSFVKPLCKFLFIILPKTLRLQSFITILPSQKIPQDCTIL